MPISLADSHTAKVILIRGRSTARKITGFSEAGYPIYEDEVVEPYIELAKTIVMLAVRDYEETYQKLLWAKREKTVRELLKMKAELESFFYSDWFETLTGTQGQGAEIIRRAKRRVMENEKDRMEKAKEKEDTVI